MCKSRSIFFVLLFFVLVVIVPVCASSSRVVSASSGMFHGVALKDDGTVWAWGAPYPGAANFSYYGVGEKDDKSILIRVDGLDNVTMVSTETACFALDKNGTVWAWGFNEEGQLGDGTYNNSATPVKVKGLEGVVEVSAGGVHSLALDKNGTVWAWGADWDGQLGNGIKVPSTSHGRVMPPGMSERDFHSNVPIRVNVTGVKQVAAGNDFSAVLKEDGTVWAWGEGLKMPPYPERIDCLSNIKMIAAGHSLLALADDGTLWEYWVEWTSWDSLPEVRLTRVEGLANVVSISSGGSHSMALLANGTVWAWGFNGEGQLGDGSTSSHTAASPVMVEGLKNITCIDAGYFNSIAVQDDGTVWAWGRNLEGQIDPGSTETKITIPKTILKGTGLQEASNSSSEPFKTQVVGTGFMTMVAAMVTALIAYSWKKRQ